MNKTVWLLTGIAFAAFSIFIFSPSDPFDRSPVAITLLPGSSVRAVQAELKRQRILPAYSPFYLIVKAFNLQNKIKAGEYSFSPSDPLPKIMTKLVRGEVLPQREIRVTFPEGSSIYHMGEILKDDQASKWKEFQALVNEGITPAVRDRHWEIFKYIPSESLEGYLFPDTYNFLAEASAETMAEVMLNRFSAVVLPWWESSKGNTPMTLHEILTLASIVEKEARLPGERPIIASVFYNRLKAGMPLAADPTVKYALERPTKVVYIDQLAVRSPYNTYKRKGLPPGPICNPGLDSIKAAVFPAKTNYYFFVAGKDGSHIFSRTWKEHQEARGKAQKM